MKQIFIVAIAIALVGASLPGPVRAQIAPPMQDVFSAFDGTATNLTHALLTFDPAGTSFVTGRQGFVHCVTATASAWSRALAQLQVPSLRAARNGCTPVRSIAASLGPLHGYPSTVGATGSRGDGSAGGPKFTGRGPGDGGAGVHVSPSSNDVFTGSTTGSSAGGSSGSSGGSGSISPAASTTGGDSSSNAGPGSSTVDTPSDSVSGQTQQGQSGSGGGGSGGSNVSTNNGGTSGSAGTNGSAGTSGSGGGSGVQGNAGHGNGADSNGVGHGNGAGLGGDKSGVGHKEKAK